MIKPTAGRDYPGSVGELLAWFTSGADGRDYLEWLRWPDGLLYSECGHVGAGGSVTVDGCARAARTAHR